MRVPSIGGEPAVGATCPVCGGAGRGSARYPEALCQPCVGELTDAEGRPVTLSNTDPLGHGVRITAGDTVIEEAEAEATPLFARGVACRAREARFGGVVVQPAAAWEQR